MSIKKFYDKCLDTLELPKMGFWKVLKEPITCLIEPSGEVTVYECSKCGSRFYEINAEEFNFCPNCRNPKREFFPDHLYADDSEYSEVD